MSQIRLVAIVLAFIASLGGTARTSAPSLVPAAQRPVDHYLLLVNTAIASMMDEAKLRQFDKSPYDGLAVAFLHAYDTSAPPDAVTMEAKMTEWKKYTHKDIWPWVYSNRFIGMNAAE